MYQLTQPILVHTQERLPVGPTFAEAVVLRCLEPGNFVESAERQFVSQTVVLLSLYPEIFGGVRNHNL